MGFNAGLNMAGSYYAATAAPFAPCPPLAGEVEADLVVVGGGCTGLSTALHAVRAGLSVVLLEGGRVGWGASGRNGGQMIPGLRKGALELVALYGRERAKALFDLAIEARGLVTGLIAEHAIDCDLRTTGHLLAAVKPSDQRQFEAEVACLNDAMAYPHAELLDASAARAEVDSPYEGGILDRLGGHMHPLNYTLGLARAAQGAGAIVHEQSAAISLSQSAGRARIATAAGAVTARHAILAGDALLHGLSSRVNSRIMPVANYVVATAPLADPAALIPRRRSPVSGTRPFRGQLLSPRRMGELLFGGESARRPITLADMAGFVRPYVEATFPALKGVQIDYAWGGLVSITLPPAPCRARGRGAVSLAAIPAMGLIHRTWPAASCWWRRSAAGATGSTSSPASRRQPFRAAQRCAGRCMCSACCGTPCATASRAC